MYPWVREKKKRYLYKDLYHYGYAIFIDKRE